MMRRYGILAPQSLYSPSAMYSRGTDEYGNPIGPKVDESGVPYDPYPQGDSDQGEWPQPPVPMPQLPPPVNMDGVFASILPRRRPDPFPSAAPRAPAGSDVFSSVRPWGGDLSPVLSGAPPEMWRSVMGAMVSGFPGQSYDSSGASPLPSLTIPPTTFSSVTPTGSRRSSLNFRG